MRRSKCPPLRPISPRDLPKVNPDSAVKTRFPARTTTNEKQCTNCGEVDTPQWRGTLCNACALWRRSRGTDRPLPLLFTVRRGRSPSEESREADESDDTGLQSERGLEEINDRGGESSMLDGEGGSNRKRQHGCGECGAPVMVRRMYCIRCKEESSKNGGQRMMVSYPFLVGGDPG